MKMKGLPEKVRNIEKKMKGFLTVLEAQKCSSVEDYTGFIIALTVTILAWFSGRITALSTIL